jgi:hypothetical protein
MHVIRTQVPFFDLTLLLLGQPSEHFPQMSPQFLAQGLPATLRNKHNMIFALPLRNG